MANLIRVALKQPLPAGTNSQVFPFTLPLVQTLQELDLGAPVTLFVGENGSGKSTLLEGIAAAAEVRAIGGSEIGLDHTLAPQRLLGRSLRLSWSKRSRSGFFLRAEDFFGYLKSRARDDARLVRELLESPGDVEPEPTDGPGASHVDERAAAKHIAHYDAVSHGESFLDLFATQLRPEGLYLLDEPEAPLSPMRQLALLSIIIRSAAAGAQFVIATHSPILLACPGARIFSFDRLPIAAVSYCDLEHVAIMRNFLSDPEAYLRHLND
jgi:predicted ATPase